jgi:hypothetical protein
MRHARQPCPAPQRTAGGRRRGADNGTGVLHEQRAGGDERDEGVAGKRDVTGGFSPGEAQYGLPSRGRSFPRSETGGIVMPHARIAVSLCAAIGLLYATPAEARIVCHGSFQVMRGGAEIATPYCENENLAAVARKYGSRVTGAEMRNSPGAKQRVCRFIGHDIRVKDACANYMPDGPGFDR